MCDEPPKKRQKLGNKSQVPFDAEIKKAINATSLSDVTFCITHLDKDLFEYDAKDGKEEQDIDVKTSHREYVYQAGPAAIFIIFSHVL